MATAARDPEQAVFTGVVQEPAAQGTPVVLTRWFRGAAPQAVVWLDNAGFEDPFGGMLRDGAAAGQQRVDLRGLPG